MCKNWTSIKIYSCGTVGNKQSFMFESCGEQDKPDHKVEEITMDSSKVKERCGQYTCRVCGAGSSETCKFSQHPHRTVVLRGTMADQVRMPEPVLL